MQTPYINAILNNVLFINAMIISYPYIFLGCVVILFYDYTISTTVVKFNFIFKASFTHVVVAWAFLKIYMFTNTPREHFNTFKKNGSN